jgi:precorrin-2 dehydrogenase/sirohydrochlorin ferrochelatase
MKLLPVALDVEGKRCLVVGGGGVAARKVRALLDCKAQVRVVAPQLRGEWQSLLSQVEYSARGYQSDDCDDCELIFACTGDRVLNARIAEDAAHCKAWCNVADDGGTSTFHLAAAVRRGEICIGITTGGGSPALAKHLKRQVENCIGDEYAALLELMSAHRAVLKTKLETQSARAAFWNGVLDSEVLSLLRAGKIEAAEALIEHQTSKTDS